MSVQPGRGETVADDFLRKNQRLFVCEYRCRFINDKGQCFGFSQHLVRGLDAITESMPAFAKALLRDHDEQIDRLYRSDPDLLVQQLVIPVHAQILRVVRAGLGVLPLGKFDPQRHEPCTAGKQIGFAAGYVREEFGDQGRRKQHALAP